RPVSVVSHSVASFTLAVAGDGFGTGATVNAGPLSTQVSLGLGAGASLRTRGVFDSGSVTTDSPSGIDVSATIATGAIVDVTSGQTVAVQTGGDAVDVAPGFAQTACLLESTHAIFVAPIDYNRDDLIDAFIIDPVGSVSLYQNHGPGAFTNTLQPFAAGCSCLVVGDLDGDGSDDVVVGLNGQPDKVFLNNSSGLFSDTGQLLGIDYGTTCLALADLDGDGDLDLIE